MIFGDAGSSWCKIFELGDAQVRIERVQKTLKSARRFEWGTGHTARTRSHHFENDLIALTKGALALVDQEDFTVLDLGANLGYFSLRLAERFDATCVAVEESYAAWLREILRANGNRRVILLRKQVSLRDLAQDGDENDVVDRARRERKLRGTGSNEVGTP